MLVYVKRENCCRNGTGGYKGLERKKKEQVFVINNNVKYPTNGRL